MMLKRLLRRDNKGIGAVEFALVAPVLISFVIGISQMGKLFFANADMKNAIAHGARVAGVWPVPSDSTIVAAVNDRIARTNGLAKATVTVVRGEDDNDNDFVTITMRYQVPLEFIFFDVGPVTLEDSRQVFTQMEGEVPEETTTSASTSASTSATSAGGTTSSTSATSAGGTTSTTSASSTGGDTSTSASSTSASTTSSTTSSSGNGNSNGGHNHGNCKKKC
jgi:Flp pilus assembly protein TadG